MGFLTDLFTRPALGTPSTPALVSPWSPSDGFEQIVVPQLLGIDVNARDFLTFETAMQIPAFKRSYEVMTGILARMPWREYEGDTLVAEQPRWLVTNDLGVPPRNLRYGVAGDLFCYGWAAVGFKLGPDDLPVDALHIPRQMWSASSIVAVDEVSADIPVEYTERVVLIGLGYGSNGFLNDGRQTLTDARIIASAYRDRISNPIAATDLEVAGDRWDGMTPDERRQLRQSYVDGRRGENGATGMHPDWLKVNHTGSLPTDLFESGRNANRLDIANHAGLPADILEGSKQGGGSGDMHYSTEAGGQARNELWDTGLAKFADAIDARMSLDDVCKPGRSIRVDPSNYLTATPTEPQHSED